MTRKNPGQGNVEECVRKVVTWAPPIYWGLVMGPVGIVAGAVLTAAAIAGSGRSDGDSSPNASQSKETGSSIR
jgi:hypothetical protein